MNAISLSLSGLTASSDTAHFSGAVHSSAAAPEMRKSSVPGPANPAARELPAPANTDRYTPVEEPDAIGRYWPGKDENGKPAIFRDGPQQRPEGAVQPEDQTRPDIPGRTEDPHASGRAKHADAPNDPDRPENEAQKDAPQSPDKPAGDAGEKRCTVNTDRVDREIEKLKQERQELERQLRSERDEARRQKTRQRLEQVERELIQKDNDAYRRQNAVYTYF